VNRVPDPAAAPSTAGVSAWNVANGLTLLRLVLVPVFGAMLLHEDGASPGWRIAAALVFAVAVVTDRLDGELARRRGLITDIGKIADPIVDKALIGTALVGLSLLGELPWWITALVLAREVGVTVLRFVVIRHGVMPAGRGGKAKTALQALAIVLFVLPLDGGWHSLAVVVMGVAVVVTLLTGLDYVYKAWVMREGSARTAARRAARRGAGPGRRGAAGASPP
jgi:CDP-diacylglycerol---glycerol-3-phosphate 3-phosphatidyltransferase